MDGIMPERFYKRICAAEVDNIRIYRLTGAALENLGKCDDAYIDKSGIDINATVITRP